MRPVTGILLAAGAGRRLGSTAGPTSCCNPCPGANPSRSPPGATSSPPSPAASRWSGPGTCAWPPPWRPSGCASSSTPGPTAASGPASPRAWRPRPMPPAGSSPWGTCLGSSRETISALAQALAAGASLVAPIYAGRRGHPVGFAALWRDRLLNLKGRPGGPGPHCRPRRAARPAADRGPRGPARRGYPGRLPLVTPLPLATPLRGVTKPQFPGALRRVASSGRWTSGLVGEGAKGSPEWSTPQSKSTRGAILTLAIAPRIEGTTDPGQPATARSAPEGA